MAGRCGCGTSTCACLLSAGEGIQILGTGSPSNPYVITNTEPGGSTCPAAMTIAELIALRDASALDVCQTYTVTDWVTANALPGPNFLLVRATKVNELSPKVLVSTPLGADLGPDWGIFNWSTSTMVELHDALLNHAKDNFGAGTIDQFAWGFANWSDNTMNGTTFTGGYATTSAAATAGGLLVANDLDSAIIDLTGATGSVNIIQNKILGAPSITSGTLMTLATSFIGDFANISNSGSSSVSVSNSQVLAGTIESTGSASVQVVRCTINGQSTLIQNSGARQLEVSNSQVTGNSSIVQSSTGSTAADEVDRCTVDGSTVTFSGATDPGTTRIVQDCNFHGGSAVTIVTGVTNATPLSTTDVTCGSTLNLQASGSMQHSRVSQNATLNTGAFAHDAVVVDGQFTVTLTAANTNTLKNKGFSDLI